MQVYTCSLPYVARALCSISRRYYNHEAQLLYGMIRHWKPRRVVEIGSGYSTKVVTTALHENGFPVEHTIIEPFRSNVVASVQKDLPPGVTTSANVIKTPVETVDMTVFESLGENDLLFIDSSHVVAPYGDTLYELLHILPALKPGVWVHIHDVYLPFGASSLCPLCESLCPSSQG